MHPIIHHIMHPIIHHIMHQYNIFTLLQHIIREIFITIIVLYNY